MSTTPYAMASHETVDVGIVPGSEKRKDLLLKSTAAISVAHETGQAPDGHRITELTKALEIFDFNK